uniref:Uncharacterized protein n=1 Tax=Arundo donax TaxID=35708 RepID=A0A0A9C889_ARUDO
MYSLIGYGPPGSLLGIRDARAKISKICSCNSIGGNMALSQ